MSTSLLLAVALSATVGLDAAGDSAAPRVGAQLDVGVPDGLGAALSLMPAASLRLQVAGLNNGVGSGLRVGAVLLAFPRAPFRPLFGVEAGHVLGGPGAWALPLLPDASLREALRGASVSLVNTQVGFELGSRHVAVVLRAGLSWVQVVPRDQEVPMSDGATLRLGGVVLSGFIPSARLGLLVCFA